MERGTILNQQLPGTRQAMHQRQRKRRVGRRISRMAAMQRALPSRASLRATSFQQRAPAAADRGRSVSARSCSPYRTSEGRRGRTKRLDEPAGSPSARHSPGSAFRLPVGPAAGCVPSPVYGRGGRGAACARGCFAAAASPAGAGESPLLSPTTTRHAR